MDSAALGTIGAHVTFDDSKTWWANGFLLPKALKESDLYLAVEVHSHGPEYAETHWEIDFVMAPNDQPPPAVEQARLSGSYPDDISVLAGLTGNKLLDMWFRVRYLADTTPMLPHLEALGVLRAFGAGDVNLVPQRFEWNVKGKTKLTQLAFEEPDADLVWLIATGEAQLPLESSIVDDLDDLAWGEVEQCLTTLA